MVWTLRLQSCGYIWGANEDCWEGEVLRHLTPSTSPPDISLSEKGKCKPTAETIIMFSFFDSLGLQCDYCRNFVAVVKL